MKPKGHLGSQKISNFVPKITGKNRYPELMYKRYCLSTRVPSPAPSMFYRGCLLAVGGKEGVLAERNLLRFHYTWLKAINSTKIEALWILQS